MIKGDPSIYTNKRLCFLLEEFNKLFLQYDPMLENQEILFWPNYRLVVLSGGLYNYILSELDNPNKSALDFVNDLTVTKVYNFHR